MIFSETSLNLAKIWLFQWALPVAQLQVLGALGSLGALAAGRAFSACGGRVARAAEQRSSQLGAEKKFNQSCEIGVSI